MARWLALVAVFLLALAATANAKQHVVKCDGKTYMLIDPSGFPGIGKLRAIDLPRKTDGYAPRCLVAIRGGGGRSVVLGTPVAKAGREAALVDRRHVAIDRLQRAVQGSPGRSCPGRVTSSSPSRYRLRPMRNRA